MDFRNLVLLCILSLQISTCGCNVILQEGDDGQITDDFIRPGDCGWRIIKDEWLATVCDGYKWSFSCRSNGTFICCKFDTPDGSCTNCGTRCPTGHYNKLSQMYVERCCLCTELTPRRRTAADMNKINNCEFGRLANDWLETECPDSKGYYTRSSREGEITTQACYNATTRSGSCNNCGSRCPDASVDTKFPCCLGCISSPWAPIPPPPPPPPPPPISIIPEPRTLPPSITPPPPPPRSCFPSNAKIHLQNGKTITMSELKIGDQKQTVSPRGKLTYSKVGGFLKKQHKTITVYLSITTSTNNTISLSGNHLIYVRNNKMDKFSSIYADQIRIGDEVLAQQNYKVKIVKVIQISSFIMKGAFTPLTMEGNIIVDGVLASCYAFYDHDSAHFGMLPIQLFPTIMKWIFGNDNGSSAYVSIVGDIGGWLLPVGYGF